MKIKIRFATIGRNSGGIIFQKRLGWIASGENLVKRADLIEGLEHI